MDLKKTVAKINSLTIAVEAEVVSRKAAMVEHGSKFDKMVADARAAFAKVVAAMEKRHADKSIDLYKKVKEAEECLGCIYVIRNSGGPVEPAGADTGLVLQPEVDRRGNPA